MKVAVALTLALALTLVSASQEDSLQFLSYGVLLSREGTLDNSGQLVVLPFDLDIPDLHEVLVDFNCTQHMDINLCQEFPQLPHMINLAKQTIYQEWEEMTKELEHLLPEMPNGHEKQQRSDGLVPFAGEVGKVLLGTGSTLENDKMEDEVYEFQKRVGNLSETIRENTRFLQELTNLTRDKFENLQQEVIALYKDMVTRYALLKRAEDQSFKLGVESSLFVAVQSQALWMARTLVKDFRSAVQTLSKNRLSRFFVDPVKLTKSLKDLEDTLKHHHGQYQMKEHNPAYYYHVEAAKAFLHRDNKGRRKIMVFLSAPITSNKPRYFKVYRVTAFPSPFGQGTTHTTQVTNLPKYFAVSEDRTHYMEMDEWEPSLCRDNICPGLRQENKIESPSCMLGIYLDRADIVRKHCQFKFFPEGLREFILEVQPSRVLLSNATRPFLSCDNAETTGDLPPCDLCLVTVPCRCRLLSGRSFITERVQRCNNDGDYSVLHPVNMALVLALENQTLVDSFTGSTLLAQDMELDVPSPHLAPHGVDKYLEVDRKLGLALDSTMEKIVKDDQIFQSDVQVFQSVDFAELDEDYLLWSKILPSLLWALTVAGVVTCFVLWCKSRPFQDKLKKLEKKEREQQEMIPMREMAAPAKVRLPEEREKMVVESEQL